MRTFLLVIASALAFCPAAGAGTRASGFVRLDADEDGVITMTEFSAGKKRSVAKAFHRLDKDDDGLISPPEFFGVKNLTKLLSGPSGPSGSSVNAIAAAWAQSDPSGAKAWIDSLPERTSSSAASGITESWARLDLTAAAAWLASLESSRDSDVPIPVIVPDEDAENYREIAEQWLNYLQDRIDELEDSGRPPRPRRDP